MRPGETNAIIIISNQRANFTHTLLITVEWLLDRTGEEKVSNTAKFETAGFH